MKQIYDNIYINFDHIFALSIYCYQGEYIKEEHLKKLIYINSRMVHHLKKYNLHEEILDKISTLLRLESNKYYDSIVNLALSQTVLTRSSEGYFINHKKLNAAPDFHKDRLHNSLKIFINELQQFPEIINICSKHAKLSDTELKDAVFNELLFSDDKEYRVDYSKYFSKSESKPREYGHPRFLAAKNSKIGIILSHGYKSSPKEVEQLGLYLNEAGFNVYMVRLKGHGTAPQNLENIKWEEWYNSFSTGYMLLKQKCSHIVAAGFSTGGLLALLMAARIKYDICAVVSINAALKLNDIRVNLVPTINYWNEFLTLINSKKGKKEYIIDKPENPDINYSKNYLKAVEQLSQLMSVCDDNLKNIIAPTLVIQAINDPVVNPKSGKIIYKKISSKTKEILSPNLNNHVIIRHRDEKLFSHIGNFIKENCLNNSDEHK
jgi:esterase/lipase